MSIALNQKVIALEKRLEALEMAFQVLIRSHDAPDERVLRLEGELRAMKARMGKIKEPA